MKRKALPKRYKFEPSLLTEIEKHCYSTLDFEVGGMLFGKITTTATQINGFVPALRASKQMVTLTFTHEVWESILKEGEEKFPGQQIVGWYHTHPSFGVFLSDYDKFIQTEFFKQKGQVALVVDPVAGELGWFEADGDEVRQIASDSTASGPRVKRDVGPTIAKKRVSFTTLIMACVGSLALGIGGGSAFTLSFTPPDLREVLEQRTLELQNEQLERFALQEQLGFRDGKLVLVYEVRPGDTALSIATAFYDGSPEAIEKMQSENPSLDLRNLAPGDELELVDPFGIRLGIPIPTALTESPIVTESEEVTSSSTTSESSD